MLSVFPTPSVSMPPSRSLGWLNPLSYRRFEKHGIRVHVSKTIRKNNGRQGSASATTGSTTFESEIRVARSTRHTPYDYHDSRVYSLLNDSNDSLY